MHAIIISIFSQRKNNNFNHMHSNESMTWWEDMVIIYDQGIGWLIWIHNYYFQGNKEEVVNNRGMKGCGRWCCNGRRWKGGGEVSLEAWCKENN